MIGRGRDFATLLVFLTLGCRALPSIPEHVCGNGVIEAPEDCDGFPSRGVACRPPGDVAECRLDCTPRENGELALCPPRWGCDSQYTCRPPSGGFRSVPSIIPGNAWSLNLADFNGDGRADIISQERPGLLGFTKIRVHFLDYALALDETWTSQKTLATPEAASIPRDAARSSLVFSDFRINVWLGEPDGTLIPDIYSTYFLENARTRILVLGRGEIEGITPLLLMTERPGEFGLFRPDPASERLLKVADLPAGLDDLAGDPAIGELFEDDQSDPCGEVAIAHRGAAEVQIYSVCRQMTPGNVVWRKEPVVTRVMLDPPAPLDQGVLIADMNGDGHMDLLVGAGGMLFVARGDGQRLATAEPLDASVDARAPGALAMPLAAGDVTSDGAADLVYPNGILLSRPPDGQALVFESVHERLATPWSSARIADFNGNGEPDIVAASELAVDIDFFNATGGNGLNAFTIPTTRPVRHLAVGDLDGDLLADLIFAQLGSSSSDDEVSVAFGNSTGAPSLPVPVAHVRDVRQLATYVSAEQDNAADLVVLYEQPDDAGHSGSALAMLDGAGDRSLPCPVELTTFSANDSLVSVPSVGSTLGSFVAPGAVDALALALSCDPISIECEFSQRKPDLWILPDLGSHRSAPERLGWGLDPRLAVVQNSQLETDVLIALAAGDIDADGSDEVILVGPDATGQRCVVVSASIAPGGEDRIQPRSSLVLPRPCTEPAPARVADADDDGAADILVLTGRAEGTPRLQVLWNEGGSFDADRATVIAGDGEPPQAFAVYRPAPSERLRVAVVTEHQARLFDSVGTERSFRETPLELELEHGTGIAVGDLDGDRVFDLAIADAGWIRILQAELEQR